jgi:hypothetical protein
MLVATDDTEVVGENLAPIFHRTLFQSTLFAATTARSCVLGAGHPSSSVSAREP